VNTIHTRGAVLTTRTRLRPVLSSVAMAALLSLGAPTVRV